MVRQGRVHSGKGKTQERTNPLSEMRQLGSLSKSRIVKSNSCKCGVSNRTVFMISAAALGYKSTVSRERYPLRLRVTSVSDFGLT